MIRNNLFMKYSQLMHLAMIVAGIVGFAALVGAWIAGFGGTGAFLGLPEGFLYTNALNLQVVAVSAGICTLVRMKLEKAGGSYL